MIVLIQGRKVSLKTKNALKKFRVFTRRIMVQSDNLTSVWNLVCCKC